MRGDERRDIQHKRTILRGDRRGDDHRVGAASEEGAMMVSDDAHTRHRLLGLGIPNDANETQACGPA